MAKFRKKPVEIEARQLTEGIATAAGREEFAAGIQAVYAAVGTWEDFLADENGADGA